MNKKLDNFSIYAAFEYGELSKESTLSQDEYFETDADSPVGTLNQFGITAEDVERWSGGDDR